MLDLGASTATGRRCRAGRVGFSWWFYFTEELSGLRPCRVIFHLGVEIQGRWSRQIDYRKMTVLSYQSSLRNNIDPEAKKRRSAGQKRAIDVGDV